MRTLQTRVAGYTDQTTILGNRLEVQDAALSQMTDAILSARAAIANALATDRADALMQEVSGAFNNVVTGLNTKNNGQNLFSGGQVNTPPTNATGLASLTAVTSVALLFQNADLVTSNRLDDTTTLHTGFPADQIATEAFNAFGNIQSFQEGVDGPIVGSLTAAQRTFLQGQLAVFDQAHANLVQVVSRNGINQARVTAAQTDLEHRKTMLDGMIGNITDVNMAEAISRLQQAQTSVQAAAQVFSTLSGASLLNYLR